MRGYQLFTAGNRSLGWVLDIECARWGVLNKASNDAVAFECFVRTQTAAGGLRIKRNGFLIKTKAIVLHTIPAPAHGRRVF